MTFKEEVINIQDTSIKIIHYLPGRLRIQLSRPPKKIKKIVSEVLTHKGICFAKFNPITRSLLIYYNPTEIECIEIIIRIGISLSVDLGMKPINILSNKQNFAFNVLDNYSLISVASTYIAKFLKINNTGLTLMNYNAGFSTLIAVINHALNEMKLSGSPHPEVISAVYLVNAILKNNILLASTLTWIATFGRHILSVDSDNITLQAFKVLKEDSTKNYYDVAIKQFDQSFNNNNLLKLFTSSIKYFIGINNQENSSMINKIRKISKNHGDILEGLSNNDEMIFLRL